MYSKTILLHLFLSVATFLVIVQSSQVIDSNNANQKRTFLVDYENDTFVMDGRPFRFISGSFHYFRSLPGSWRRKLRTMRAAGLNAVTTYVEWSLHNPLEDTYVWDGIADLEKFIQLAQEEDLYVILRPGPYICAERDMGGFPYWLLRKYPSIKLRTGDINYLYEIRLWYSQLMSKMEPYLYGNGGPIIMVQIENEYGSFSACDKMYTGWLRDETHEYVKNKAVLFTTDGPGLLKCGQVNGVLATIDFGSSRTISPYWRELRKYQPKGPLVNSEYYPGWLTHWQEPMQRVGINGIIKTFVDMLEDGANVNFYMFYGGTNFGFTAGANDGGLGRYNADVTSYDYDAPMDESGDPTTKYTAIRNVISKYLPMPNISVPQPLPKKNYGKIPMSSCCSILSYDGRKHLSKGIFSSVKPKTFEALDQYSGLVLYETELPKLKKDPSVLKIKDIRDRAYVYVDRNFVGVLSRENLVNSLPILPGSGNKLQIVVENQGRINYKIPNDFKGILGDVVMEQTVLTNWNMTKFPLDDYNRIEELIQAQSTESNAGFRTHNNKGMLRTGPSIFYGEVEIKESELFDTYLDPTGWGKGVAFINGFNLGRYWPVVGPQITLYVPKEVLKYGTNRVVLLEYQRAPESAEVTLTDTPSLDGIQ